MTEWDITVTEEARTHPPSTLISHRKRVFSKKRSCQYKEVLREFVFLLVKSEKNALIFKKALIFISLFDILSSTKARRRIFR